MRPDAINGLFELLGGMWVWHNVVVLRRDKMVRGVSWVVQALFTAWGWWNLYYYPHLGQWASFAGGVMMVVANSTWTVLAVRYRRN